MSFSLADSTGLLDEFASIGGLVDFVDWALTQTPTIRRLARLGYTEDLVELKQELSVVPIPAKVQAQVHVILDHIDHVEDVLIITDGMSDEPRVLGGAGSGNYGHAGRPGEVGGSGPATNALGQTVEENGKWNESSAGEKPYGWTRLTGDAYTVPTITHQVVRDGGIWGSSHGNSQMMTGYAADVMGISGYSGRGQLNESAQKHVDNFLTHIAEDGPGSEEQLHHSFENVRKTDFQIGDTFRLPLTATSGDVGHYGVRLDAESQSGQPTLFEFEKGTQMVAYSTMTLRDAKDLGHASIDEARKEFGKVWDEALVAGGFKVVGVRTEYMGSQHSSTQGLHPNATHQIYGKVVRLKQIATFDPKAGWKPRG